MSYIWMRRYQDFYQSKRIKMIRRMEDGLLYLLIYDKLQLASLPNDARLEFSGDGNDLFDELSYEIDEDAEDIERTVDVLSKKGLIEYDGNSIFFPWVKGNTGIESSDAKRSRLRRRNMTEEEKEKVKEYDRERKNNKKENSDQIPTKFRPIPTNSDQFPRVDIDIDKDKEKNIDKDKNIDSYSSEQKCSEQTVYELPLVDGTTFEIKESDYQGWIDAYPAVDVFSEFRKMKSWLNCNERKRKTRKGIKRFVDSWLSREQDKPHIKSKAEIRADADKWLFSDEGEVFGNECAGNKGPCEDTFDNVSNIFKGL